jgi:hypothetical protein
MTKNIVFQNGLEKSLNKQLQTANISNNKPSGERIWFHKLLSYNTLNVQFSKKIVKHAKKQESMALENKTSRSYPWEYPDIGITENHESHASSNRERNSKSNQPEMLELKIITEPKNLGSHL